MNQLDIAIALRKYQSNSKDRETDFKAILKQKIAKKQAQYDALMQNLSTGALPPAVVADMGEKMQVLKAEMDALAQTTPPPDYTSDQIKTWLKSIKAAPDEKAIHMLIERIDVIPDQEDKNKTTFSIQSTLKTVLGENVSLGQNRCTPKSENKNLS